YAAFRTGVVEGVDQLVWLNSCDGNDEACRADKVGSLCCWGDWRWWRQWSSNRDRSVGWKINGGNNWYGSGTDRDRNKRDDHEKQDNQQDSELCRPHDPFWQQLLFQKIRQSSEGKPPFRTCSFFRRPQKENRSGRVACPRSFSIFRSRAAKVAVELCLQRTS